MHAAMDHANPPLCIVHDAMFVAGGHLWHMIPRVAQETMAEIWRHVEIL